MCELFIQADHLYYEKWGSNVDTVIELITNYVLAANSIYEATGIVRVRVWGPRVGDLLYVVWVPGVSLRVQVGWSVVYILNT